MSEKDEKALDTIARAYPKMSEFDKGYILGVAESRIGEKQTRDSGKENEAEQEKNNMALRDKELADRANVGMTG